MQVVELVPNVYQLPIMATNVVVIVEDSLTLVDAGYPVSSSRIADFLRQLGRSISEIGTIIITHNHVDHIGAVPELRGLADLKVVAHRAGLADVHEDPSYPEGVRRLLRFPPFSGLRRHFVLEPGDVDIKLEGDEILEQLGGLRVIHTPGHTPGSISLYSAEHKLLIVGDALQQRRKGPRLPARRVSTDLELAAESIQKMAALDFEVLCYGHGRPLTRDAHAKLQALADRVAC